MDVVTTPANAGPGESPSTVSARTSAIQLSMLIQLRYHFRTYRSRSEMTAQGQVRSFGATALKVCSWE